MHKQKIQFYQKFLDISIQQEFSNIKLIFHFKLYHNNQLLFYSCINYSYLSLWFSWHVLSSLLNLFKNIERKQLNRVNKLKQLIVEEEQQFIIQELYYLEKNLIRVRIEINHLNLAQEKVKLSNVGMKQLDNYQLETTLLLYAHIKQLMDKEEWDQSLPNQIQNSKYKCLEYSDSNINRQEKYNFITIIFYKYCNFIIYYDSKILIVIILQIQIFKMASITELKDVLKQTLEQRGILSKIRATIRSQIFNTLHDNPSSNPQLSNQNLIINQLIREYLSYNNYTHTLSVFIPQTGQPISPPFDRNYITKKLKLQEDKITHQLPLLYGLTFGAKKLVSNEQQGINKAQDIFSIKNKLLQK